MESVEQKGLNQWYLQNQNLKQSKKARVGKQNCTCCMQPAYTGLARMHTLCGCTRLPCDKPGLLSAAAAPHSQPSLRTHNSTTADTLRLTHRQISPRNPTCRAYRHPPADGHQPTNRPPQACAHHQSHNKPHELTKTAGNWRLAGRTQHCMVCRQAPPAHLTPHPSQHHHAPPACMLACYAELR